MLHLSGFLSITFTSAPPEGKRRTIIFGFRESGCVADFGLFYSKVAQPEHFGPAGKPLAAFYRRRACACAGSPQWRFRRRGRKGDRRAGRSREHLSEA